MVLKELSAGFCTLLLSEDPKLIISISPYKKYVTLSGIVMLRTLDIFRKGKIIQYIRVEKLKIKQRFLNRSSQKWKFFSNIFVPIFYFFETFLQISKLRLPQIRSRLGRQKSKLSTNFNYRLKLYYFSIWFFQLHFLLFRSCRWKILHFQRMLLASHDPKEYWTLVFLSLPGTCL